MKPENRSIVTSFESQINFTSFKLRYPELYVEEHWQNRPVIWFVAKREGYNGMMQNNDFAKDSLSSLSNALLEMKSDSLTQKFTLNIYPNPFKDYFSIESPFDDEILIQEPSGRVILHQKILRGKNRIQTQSLSNGFYFIHFIRQSKTAKLIKQ